MMIDNAKNSVFYRKLTCLEYSHFVLKRSRKEKTFSVTSATVLSSR